MANWVWTKMYDTWNLDVSNSPFDLRKIERDGYTHTGPSDQQTELKIKQIKRLYLKCEIPTF